MAISVVSKNVSPLPGAIVRPGTAGAAIGVGASFGIDSSAKIVPASSTVAPRGVIVSVGTFGALSAASGDRVGCCYYGPVAGFAGITPGSTAYQSATAGVVDDTTTSGVKVGFGVDPNVLWVNPAE